MFLTNSITVSLYNNCEKGDEMYYELYVDSLFLVNFVMNLYLLLLVNQKTHRTATRSRLILGALVGAVLFLLPFLWVGPVWFRMAVGVISGTLLMIFTAFRIRSAGAFFLVLEKLLLYSFLMGGILLFLIRSLPFMRKFLTGIFGIMGAGAVIFLLLSYGRERREKNSLCKVTLIYKGNRMTVTALIDSGNSLIEPISGKPVSILDKSVFQSLWKEDSNYYRAIPFHSIGKSRGILQGYLLPQMQIEKDGMVKICRDVYIAVGEEEISLERQERVPVRMILNPGLFSEEAS